MLRSRRRHPLWLLSPRQLRRQISRTPRAPATETLSHNWVDYGGICLRPDNLPEGVAVNPDKKAIDAARLKILEALWRVIELSSSSAN